MSESDLPVQCNKCAKEEMEETEEICDQCMQNEWCNKTVVLHNPTDVV